MCGPPAPAPPWAGPDSTGTLPGHRFRPDCSRLEGRGRGGTQADIRPTRRQSGHTSWAGHHQRTQTQAPERFFSWGDQREIPNTVHMKHARYACSQADGPGRLRPPRRDTSLCAPRTGRPPSAAAAPLHVTCALIDTGVSVPRHGVATAMDCAPKVTARARDTAVRRSCDVGAPTIAAFTYHKQRKHSRILVKAVLHCLILTT